MARIAGVNVPTNKRVLVALTYVHGIGLTSSKNICKQAGIAEDKRINSLSEDELTKIRDLIDTDYLVEGDLRRKTSMDVKRYLDLGCLRGLRHRKNLPVRGHPRNLSYFHEREGHTPSRLCSHPSRETSSRKRTTNLPF